MPELRPASFASSIFAAPGARGFGINHLLTVHRYTASCHWAGTTSLVAERGRPGPVAAGRVAMHCQEMIDSESACPWGREDRAGEGRRAKFRHECLDESEDARPATICS